MSDFEYTHNPRVNSSAVDEVWYNADNKELAVNLHDEVYVYQNVPFARYQALVFAGSVGRAFREVKRDYGPSEYLGYRSDLDIEQKSYAAPDMSGGYARGGLVTTPRTVIHDATKSEPVNTNDEPVNTAGGPSEYVSLKVEDVTTSRNHRVVFETEHGVKTHDVPAESVDEAKAVVENLATLLGVDAKVKEVTVYFE